MLEKAGWKKGADGVREKDGKKLKFVYQTSVNSLRQKEQAIVKQACQKAGIDLELKAVTASVFFSSDVANPDTYSKFWYGHPDVHDDDDAAGSRSFMDQYLSCEDSSKANKWQGSQHRALAQRRVRQAVPAAEGELDPVKRAAMFIRLNDCR